MNKLFLVLSIGILFTLAGCTQTTTKSEQAEPSIKNTGVAPIKISFKRDVLPFFTQSGMWFKGSQPCSSCHFGVSESSAHELGLGSYDDMMKGADSLGEPPGVSILGESKPGAGDFNWEKSKLRGRLRNNRMPPGFPFLMDQSNRNGPCVEWDGEKYTTVKDSEGNLKYNNCNLTAVELIGNWVDQGAKNN